MHWVLVRSLLNSLAMPFPMVIGEKHGGAPRVCVLSVTATTGLVDWFHAAGLGINQDATSNVLWH